MMRIPMSKFLLITWTLMTMSLMACKDNDMPPTDTPAEESNGGLLQSVLKSEAYDPEELMNAVMPGELISDIVKDAPNLHPIIEGTMRLKVFPSLLRLDEQFRKETGCEGLLCSRKWQLESYVFTYLSTAIDGSEVLLSGRVTFPNRLDSGGGQDSNTAEGAIHEVQALSLITHPRVVALSWQPSESMSLFTLRAFLNSAVIEPDLQGFGINVGQNYCPRLGTAALARQTADCISAALEVMEQRGVRLAADGYTTSWGGSQLALTTLKFHQYYETRAPQAFRQAVRLHSTFVATNVRNELDVIMSELQEGKNLMVNYRNIIYAMCALSPQQRRGYQVGDFIAESAKTELITVDNRPIKISEFLGLKSSSAPVEDEMMTIYDYLTTNSVVMEPSEIFSKVGLGLTIDHLVASDMLTSDGKLDPTSPKMVAMREILNEMTEAGTYSPTVPLYLCQNKNDELFMESDFQRYYDELSQNGINPNVHKGDISTHDIVDYLSENTNIKVYHYVSYIKALMEMATAETPETAFHHLNPTTRNE